MLSGLRAIIVEDNFAVAHSLGILLEGLGCEVVGKAANVDDARALVDRVDFDIAILDISLGNSLVTDVARKVVEAGKRIVYLTGFAGTDLLPEDLRSHVCLAKPVRPEALVEAVLGVKPKG
jgi:two-component SAPR family response regulator